jgi:hypothetical protein
MLAPAIDAALAAGDHADDRQHLDEPTMTTAAEAGDAAKRAKATKKHAPAPNRR